MSYNELYSVTTKALAAYGFPPGVDSDNAKNIVWLELQKCIGIKQLVQEMRKIGKITKWKNSESDSKRKIITIRNEIQSGLILAQTAIDIALTGTKVQISKCSFPLIILAEAARRSHGTKALEILGKSNDILINALCHNQKLLLTHNVQNLTGELTLSIQQRAVENLDHAQFHYFYKQKLLSEPIAIAPETWAWLVSIANDTLVPSDAISRSRAGA